MPLDVLGHTRVTLMKPASISPSPEGAGNLVKLHRAGDRPLQFLVLNEEFLVSTSHQLVLITSLPFVHTARRSYRLSNPVNNSDRDIVWVSKFCFGKSSKPYYLEEGEVVTRFP